MKIAKIRALSQQGILSSISSPLVDFPVGWFYLSKSPYSLYKVFAITLNGLQANQYFLAFNVTLIGSFIVFKDFHIENVD